MASKWELTCNAVASEKEKTIPICTGVRATAVVPRLVKKKITQRRQCYVALCLAQQTCPEAVPELEANYLIA